MSKSVNPNFRRAKLADLKIVEPAPNEIQIDVDSVKALRVFAWQWELLTERGITHGWKARFSPSRQHSHAHITITLPTRRSLRERVLLAALLGSDLRREAFNYCRVVNRKRQPVVFFERK